MNRAILLARPDPDKEDLYRTAEAIMQSCQQTIKLQDSTTKLLKAVAGAYFEFRKKQQSTVAEYGMEAPTNFHGLRDYYALVKGISSSQAPTEDDINVSVARNFGGLPTSGEKFTFTAMLPLVASLLIVRVRACAAVDFLKLLDHEQGISKTIPRQMPTVVNLVRRNLTDLAARHLMLITRGDAAICLLNLPEVASVLRSPAVMLASRFRDDQKEDHAYQQLSKIILYMESGRQLIIKDHDKIYGALYDMLNQHYSEMRSGGTVTRNCRVALGAMHNPRCQVHESFRVIMLEEATKITMSDPPRLNRCEKQLMSYSDVLTVDQQSWVDHLQVSGRDAAVTSRALKRHMFHPTHRTGASKYRLNPAQTATQSTTCFAASVTTSYRLWSWPRSINVRRIRLWTLLLSSTSVSACWLTLRLRMP